jgi:hypothetical protein
MPDQDLWDIAAYLKRGLKPVTRKVIDSEGPPDFWASEYTAEKSAGIPLCRIRPRTSSSTRSLRGFA